MPGNVPKTVHRQSWTGLSVCVQPRLNYLDGNDLCTNAILINIDGITSHTGKDGIKNSSADICVWVLQHKIRRGGFIQDIAHLIQKRIGLTKRFINPCKSVNNKDKPNRGIRERKINKASHHGIQTGLVIPPDLSTETRIDYFRHRNLQVLVSAAGVVYFAERLQWDPRIIPEKE